MAVEAASLERSEPGAPQRAVRWLRERVSRGRTALDRAIEEAVQENPDLVCPYPKPVDEALIARLDKGFRLRDGELLEQERIIGFRCEERPVMIVIGNPMTPGFTEYRLEVQGDRCLEMELAVAGTGRDRRVLRAVTWIEAQGPGGHGATMVTEKRDMELAEVIRLAADLEGRIRDDTFGSVERVPHERR